MKCLCVVSMCLVLAASVDPESCYPKHINIEKDVLGFLTLENEPPFCTMAFATDRLGITTTSCFVGMDLKKTEIFVKADETRYKINKIQGEKKFDDLKKSRLALINLKRRRTIPNEYLLGGLYQADVVHGITDNKLKHVYGYIEETGKAGIVEIESIQCYGETLSIVNLRSKPRGINLMGGLVIYGRNLIAICIWESENKDFPCLPINNFVKNNVLPNIEEENRVLSREEMGSSSMSQN